METGPIEVLITLTFPDALITDLIQDFPRVHITLLNARKVEEVPDEIWPKVEVLYTDRVLPDPSQVPNIKWVQFHFAGIDFAVDSPVVQKTDLLITTLSGAAAPQMAEYVVMMMLALGHRMPDFMVNQVRGEWPHDRWERFCPRELRDSTVGIIGYGSIGREVARLLYPFGVKILAVKRDVRHPEDSDYITDGLGDPDGKYFTRLYPVQAIKSVLKESDFVVVCLPLTPETNGLISEHELAVMKPTAFLIDIGRGGVVQQNGLIAALQDRKIAGAALDVFTEEPLISNNPLWRLPNVIITPHIGGISSVYRERAIHLFRENLHRYINDQPLLNQFHLSRGY
jgi:phosphoglycerate dehydrogenase-like enzyme